MKHRFPLSAALSLFTGLSAMLACASSGSDVYETLPGATAMEQGDRVPGERRIVPFSAALTLDLMAAPPSFTTLVFNAVLEGGDPFLLAIRGSNGIRLDNGDYRFMGDYLRGLHPSGTQYLYDWTFSISTNGSVVWNGHMGWAGGHLWHVAISNLTLVPAARLSISRVERTSVQLSWAIHVTDHVLEQAVRPSDADWIAVTNTVTHEGDAFSVTVDAVASQRFYRLRRR